MAAASFDNVLCISAFGVCLGIAFDSGKTKLEYSKEFILHTHPDYAVVSQTWQQSLVVSNGSPDLPD